MNVIKAKHIRKNAISLFCILLFCYGYIHQKMGANQNSRLDLLHSIVVYDTFRIDAYAANTKDKSTFNGHFYSDKAPGIVFLALPSFMIATLTLADLNIPLDSPRGWQLSSWITTVGSVGLITALGAVAMFVCLCQLVDEKSALLTCIVVFLGAAPFPYATMLFSHAAVIGLLSIALWAILDQPFVMRMGLWTGKGVNYSNSAHETKRHILAGLCCGMAIASEYTAALAAGGLLALAFFGNARRGFTSACAASLPLLLIPLYNWFCFENPFAFGYHHLAMTQFQAMNRGFFGISFPPNGHGLYVILLSPERGLFFWTPFFLLAVIGVLAKSKVKPGILVVVLSTIVLQVMCVSGYYMPNGGSALGPRHLSSILPFVAMLSAYGLSKYSRLGIILSGMSLLFTGVATLIDAMPSTLIQNPLLHYYFVNLKRGMFVPSFFSMDGSGFFGIFPAFLLLFGAFLWGVLSGGPSEIDRAKEPAITTQQT